jgi:hypothetical protein
MQFMETISQYLFQRLHNNKKTIVYKYTVLLVHVLAYNGHLHGGGYQRKELLWLIMLDMCSYEAKTHVLNKFYGKMFVTRNLLTHAF